MGRGTTSAAAPGPRGRRQARSDREDEIRSYLIAFTCLALLFTIYPVGFRPGKAPPARNAGASPDRARLLASIDSLAAFPTRFAGSADRERVRDWLMGEIEIRGLEPRVQTFSLRVGLAETEQANVYAVLPGRRSHERWILLVAHYDSVNEGWAGENASLVDPESPAPGANDNGSGVAVLLESMRLLSADPPERGVIFLFTAAEEMGQRGARAWAEHAPTGLSSLGWVLNVDQIGKSRSGPRGMQIFTRGPGIPFAKRLRVLAETACPGILGWRLHLQDTLAKSDHGPFLDLGLQALSLSEGPGYYPWENQGAGDLPGKVDPVLLEAAVRLVNATARERLLPPP